MKTVISNERGFTLAEVLVASLVTMLILGGAVALTSAVQQSYRKQIEDSAAEQEGRYALEWVSRLIRGAGNNPYALPPMDTHGTPDPADDTPIPPACPPGAPNPPYLSEYKWLVMDPNGDGVNDDIRIQTDSNPPDGVLGGATAATCNQANEDVTVSYDPATLSITFLDNNLGGTASIRTDAVIAGLNFTYRKANHDVTPNAAAAAYVETQVTVRTRTIDAATQLPVTRVLSQEVRIRGRNY
jgi:type II secretory pathway pseudopilin PulG